MIRLAAACFVATAASGLFAQKGEEIRAYASEDERLIDRARESADGYFRKLPDFVCDQTTVRWWRRGDDLAWRKRDEIRAELAYLGGEEEFRNLRVDGLRVVRGTPSEKGLWSWGEYATALADVMALQTRARFWALGESPAGEVKARLFEYRVERHRSQWKIRFGGTVIPAYTGRVWIDPVSARVLRMEMHAGDLPATSEAESVEVSVEYDWTYVAGGTYVLPVKARITAALRAPARHLQNELAFSNYRKYTVTSAVLSSGGEVTSPELPGHNTAPPRLPDDETIAKARAAAEEYSATLPDFACDQQTLRQISRGRKLQWFVQDWIHSELVYTGGKEHYRNATVSGKSVGVEELQSSGSWSKGEFGSTLRDLFSPATDARFTPAGESKRNGRVVKAYDFAVDEPGSHWLILYGDPVYPAYKGRVWVDSSDGRVLQIEKNTSALPEQHPVERVAARLEYGWVKIDGKSHLLPVKAETMSCYRHSFECRKNDIEFRNYRKFEVESKLVP